MTVSSSSGTCDPAGDERLGSPLLEGLASFATGRTIRLAHSRAHVAPSSLRQLQPLPVARTGPRLAAAWLALCTLAPTSRHDIGSSHSRSDARKPIALTEQHADGGPGRPPRLQSKVLHAKPRLPNNEIERAKALTARASITLPNHRNAGYPTNSKLTNPAPEARATARCMRTGIVFESSAIVAAARRFLPRLALSWSPAIASDGAGHRDGPGLAKITNPRGFHHQPSTLSGRRPDTGRVHLGPSATG